MIIFQEKIKERGGGGREASSSKGEERAKVVGLGVGV
jgi:hypothetical protein